MSITYGHFSGPLSVTVKSGNVTGAAVYFTIPWYNASYIDRIRIYSPSGSTTGIDNLYILANGAHERQGDFTALDEYIYIDTTDKALASGTNFSAQWSVDPGLYYEDKYGRNYLHIKIDFAAAASVTHQQYVITVTGRKASHASLQNTEATSVDKTVTNYRVLLGKGQAGNGGTGGIITDITNYARMAAFGTTAGIAIGATNDYIYVGSSVKIDHIDFGVGTASTTCSGLQGQLWNGTTWSAFTLLDNTAGTAGSSLRYSGVVEGLGIGSSTWAATKFDPALSILLPNDPNTVYENQILAGTAPALGFFSNPQRFWTRYNVPANVPDVTFLKHVLPIAEKYFV